MMLISLNQVFNDAVCRDRVLTPRRDWEYLGTLLSIQITAEYGLCSAVPIIRWARDAEKGCLLALVDTWHLTSCDAWHHNTWHRTVTRHTRDRNNPEQLYGCYLVLWPSSVHLQTRAWQEALQAWHPAQSAVWCDTCHAATLWQSLN